MGETDISGLGLLEAHFGLDWAAEGLDLTSSNTGSLLISIHVFSFFTKASQLILRTLSHRTACAVSI